ncbi:MAG: hypothetical protein J6A94_11690 [Lachnospiraceae bacterium]|nr:hypothetical protein [Lachnospiraceae bacterium]
MKITDMVKGKRALLLSQISIMVVVCLLWLLNRGNAFQKTYSLDEFNVSEAAIVGQDVTIDDTMSSGGVFLETPMLSLGKGVYQVNVGYNANIIGNSISVNSESLEEGKLLCSDAILNPHLHNVAMTLELKEGAEDICLSANFGGSGYISITNVSIFETSVLYKRNIFYGFLLCVMLALIYAFFESTKETKGVMLALSGIFLISVLPMFNDYLIYGHDLHFHLLRIEGMKLGFSKGIFPVKIHPLWLQDYGYAVGVFYGDLALYFPAVLRLLGISVQDSYKFFVAAMNLGTILIAYYSFKRIFASRVAGILASMLCCLNYFRLLDLYRRVAIGECLGIMLFPLVFLAFYLVLTETNEKNWWKYAILTAFALTGLLQSHIISSGMACVFILFFCIICIKKVFQKYIFRSLALAAGLTVLLNVGFYVPFLDYYNGEIGIASEEWAGNAFYSGIQRYGTNLIEMFSMLNYEPGTGFMLEDVKSGYAIGTSFGVGILLFLAFLICRFGKFRKDKNFKLAIICFSLGCFMLFMSTIYFPWDALAELGAVVEKVCGTLQYPWRMLAPGLVFLCFAFCYVVCYIQKNCSKKVLVVVMAGMTAFMLLDSGWSIYDRLVNGGTIYVHATEDINTMHIATEDYLPIGTDAEEIEGGWINKLGISSLESYVKDGTEINCSIKAEEQGGYVEFPLNYYKYYFCKDNLGQFLPVSAGYNGMLRVTFPANYEGSIQVAFKEPWFWRLAELISALTLCGCVAVLVWDRRKKE